MMHDGVGGISTGLARACVPWVAFALAIALTLVMVLVNHSQLDTKPQQMVTTAIFCIVGATMYLIYMSVNRLLKVVLVSIESAEYGTLKRKRSGRFSALSEVVSRSSAVGEADASEKEEGDDTDPLIPLGKGDEWKGVDREDVIASMYLGGSGAFLALPALCMWDTSVTAAFLCSMQLGGLWERVKVLEYKPNIDRATAIGILRSLHWSQHALMFMALFVVVWQDWQTR